MPSAAPCFASWPTLCALQASTTGTQLAVRPTLPSTTRNHASLGFPAFLRQLFKQSLFISVSESFFEKAKIRFFAKHGMVGWQINHYIEQKLARKNKKRVFRSPRQQRAAPALELNDAKLTEGMDTNPTEGKYNDLINGVHEKTKNVKT